MNRRILVPTDGSEYAAIGVAYAIAVARHYDATVHGLHVVDIKLLEGPFLRDLSASLGTAPYLNYQGNIAMILEERGDVALHAVHDACAAAGVPCETTRMTGIVSRCILERAQLADLVVMGRGGEHSEWLDGLVGSTTAAVVRKASQPVLVTAVRVPERNRFVLAYDGSVHAKKALRTAAGIAEDWAMPCHVLVVSDKRPEATLDEARTYLSTHDVRAEYITRQGDPSEVIVEYAKECEADLLLMGAYGHTKVRELVVGSTTAYALNHAPCPLLLTR